MWLREIAEIIGGELRGEDLWIEKVSTWDRAGERDLIFVFEEKSIKDGEKSKAKAMVIPKISYSSEKSLVLVDNPKLAFAKILRYFDWHFFPSHIHPTSILGENVKIGKDVGIGAYTVIGNNVIIGDNTKIYPHVTIGNDVIIGSNVTIYPNVSIYDHCIIGNNVIIHSGSVIGSDGFGYVWDGNNHVKIPHIGKVIIEDDVEIGANCTIDRGTIDETVIGKGTKIDNLVTIAHNVKIGENCIIVGQSGVAGSSSIGNNVIIAGQSGVSDHVKVGNNVVILARTGVTKDIPDNLVVSGFPARPHSEELKIQAILKKLPEIWEKLKKL
ncbi:MAG: UDP-3-O-(3-hydroxymyristoyl)glucosamine N-acyltransferase [Dictyoglomus sp. NZ13-RE01]|nr:MAG: UDP-3-O-(3-hydroxymyristoyl)glucosamine N-acyltransferase [Dictyoglomus sp. NZ13-RE01]